MKIVKFKDENCLVDLVNVHIKAFNGFFLTSLGSGFLKVYYKSLIKSEKGILFVIKNDEDKVIGFVAGTTKYKGFHKEILFKNLFSYVRILFFVVLMRPLAIFRLFLNLKKGNNCNIDSGNLAELLSIGILPSYKGLGYGKLLINAFEKELTYRQIKQSTLTTDFYDNDKVINFYKSLGYEILHEFISYPNRRMYKLIKKL